MIATRLEDYLNNKFYNFFWGLNKGKSVYAWQLSLIQCIDSSLINESGRFSAPSEYICFIPRNCNSRDLNGFRNEIIEFLYSYCTLNDYYLRDTPIIMFNVYDNEFNVKFEARPFEGKYSFKPVEFTVMQINSEDVTYFTKKLERSGRYLVGRSKDCDLVINDPLASSNHAELLLMDDGKIKITDLESANGTKINKKRIEPGVNILITENDMVNITDDFKIFYRY